MPLNFPFDQNCPILFGRQIQDAALVPLNNQPLGSMGSLGGGSELTGIQI